MSKKILQYVLIAGFILFPVVAKSYSIYDTTLEIQPNLPTTTPITTQDTISFVIGGSFATGGFCVPSLNPCAPPVVTIDQPNHKIDINFYSTAPTGDVTQALVPFSYTVSAGPLKAGIYTVNAVFWVNNTQVNVVGPPATNPVTQSFTVVEDVLAVCPDGSTLDTDGDALLDCWEKDGIDSNGDGNIDLQLYDVNKDGNIDSSEQADPKHKDIYLEIDWMALHQPDPTAIANVINSFAAAPVTNPDGKTGIRLHIQADEEAVAHNNELTFVPCTVASSVAPTGTPDFDKVKLAYFGTAGDRGSQPVLNAKRFAFHYSLFTHDLSIYGSGGLPAGYSGCAELPGNDFVVSLGHNGWGMMNGHEVGNVDQQSGTLIHELGHNLNLHHGGVDDINYKPNYLSVMNYSRQFDMNFVTRPLDYSIQALLILGETQLDEYVGIGLPSGYLFHSGVGKGSLAQTAYSHIVGNLCYRVGFVPADGSIDWNLNNTFDTNFFADDINDLDCFLTGYQTLKGYDDWSNLFYNFRVTSDYADGMHLSAPLAVEMNIEDAALISPETDGDGIVNILDNCPLTANADQKDSNGNGVGDACEGDLDHDGDIDQDDLNKLLAQRNKPASGPHDPMDLDGDGKITALDARKLTLKCTRLRCATH